MIDKKSRKGEINHLIKGILPIVAYVGFIVFFVLMQKHLSASGVILFVAFSMLLIAGIKKTYILILGSVAGVFAVIGVIIEPFRVIRIFSFLDPYADRLGDGHHIIQSYYALGGGGLSGVGLGMSRQKFQWLPENHTDFILSVIGEEMGFVGIVLVIVMFTWFLIKGLLISFKANDYFGRILGLGIVSLFFFQYAINAMVVTGVFPVTGMVFPFISYGGTATIMFMGAVGVLFNISSQIMEKENELKEKNVNEQELEVEVNDKL